MSEHDKSRGGISLKSAEIIVAVLLFIFGSGVAFDSYRLGAQWDADGPQSGYFPFYIGLMIAIASMVTLTQALLRVADARAALFVSWKALKQVMAVLVPAAVYVLAVQLIGIYIASVVYIAVFMIWLGQYPWWKGMAVALIVIISFYFMFEIWFKVPLFKGSYDLLGMFGR